MADRTGRDASLGPLCTPERSENKHGSEEGFFRSRKLWEVHLVVLLLSPPREQRRQWLKQLMPRQYITVVCCDILIHTAIYCYILSCTVIYCWMMVYAVTCCHVLLHTVTYSCALVHTVIYRYVLSYTVIYSCVPLYTVAYWLMLVYTVIHCYLYTVVYRYILLYAVAQCYTVPYWIILQPYITSYHCCKLLLCTVVYRYNIILMCLPHRIILLCHTVLYWATQCYTVP